MSYTCTGIGTWGAMGQETGFVAEIGGNQGSEGKSVNPFREGLVPVPWGKASYEMFLLEHEGFGGDGAEPATKWGIWNMGGASGRMNRPGGPGDGCHGPASLRPRGLTAVGWRARHPLCGAGFPTAPRVSYPCTAIGTCWTVVHLVRRKREIGGNHPLQDGFSEHLGSRVASSPVGQRHVGIRTVVHRDMRAVLDSGRNEFGQLSIRLGPGRAGRLAGAGRCCRRSRAPAGGGSDGADTRARGTPAVSASAAWGALAGQASRRNSPSAEGSARTAAARTGWQRESRT